METYTCVMVMYGMNATMKKKYNIYIMKTEFYRPRKHTFSIDLFPILGYEYTKDDECKHLICFGWLFWAVTIEF